MTPAERLWTRVDKSAGPTGCWLWTGYVMRREGYGQIHVDRRTVLTHRMAFELSTGQPIPAGMQIDHICHVRRCCNPQHLRLVTNKQNSENCRGAHRDSRSGIRGVQQLPSGRWAARVGSKYIGSFDTAKQAKEATRLRRNELFTHNDADRR